MIPGIIEVSNTKYASRLLLNPDVPEVIDFSSRYASIWNGLHMSQPQIYIPLMSN